MKRDFYARCSLQSIHLKRETILCKRALSVLFLFLFLFFFKSLLNLLQYCLFFVLVFWPHSMWDLNSPTRDLEPVPPALESKVLTTGPPGKSPVCPVSNGCLYRWGPHWVTLIRKASLTPLALPPLDHRH